MGFGGTIYVDHAAAQLADFVCGANEKDVHFDRRELGTRSARAEIRGHPQCACRVTRVPTGNGTLEIARGIEVGHIFQLGQLYSDAMQATVLDEQGKSVTMFMGCYGIGVTRVVAAAIEQNHDANGIIWPEPLAPFNVVAGADQLPEIRARCAVAADRLYEDLRRRRHRRAARRSRRASRA